MRLQGHAAVKVPMAFAGKLLAGKQGAAEEVAEVAEVAGDTERVHNGGSKALPIYIDKAGARSLTPTPRAPYLRPSERHPPEEAPEIGGLCANSLGSESLYCTD